MEKHDTLSKKIVQNMLLSLNSQVINLSVCTPKQAVFFLAWPTGETLFASFRLHCLHRMIATVRGDSLRVYLINAARCLKFTHRSLAGNFGRRRRSVDRSVDLSVVGLFWYFVFSMFLFRFPFCLLFFLPMCVRLVITLFL